MTLWTIADGPRRAEFWRKDMQFWQQQRRKWMILRWVMNAEWALPVVFACFGPSIPWFVPLIWLVSVTFQEYITGDPIRFGLDRCRKHELDSYDKVLWLEAGIVPPEWVARYAGQEVGSV